MTVRLAVAGAFHTQFMKPAEEKLRCALCFFQLQTTCLTPQHASCTATSLDTAASVSDVNNF